MGQLRPKYAHCCEKTTQPARQRHRTLICYCRTIPLKSFLGGKCDKKVNSARQHSMSKRIAQFGSKYVVTAFNSEEKAKRRKEEFPKDCEKAFNMGAKFAKRSG
jgi:hypothetical protein